MINEETAKMPENEIKKDDDNVVQHIDNQSGTKPKRKSRSSRRRLNAMMSNVSLHFSDTDSEGELPTVVSQKRNLSPAAKRLLNKLPEPPMISVTVENAEGETVDSHWDGFGDIENNNTRRSSFAENLTDIDEIYGSENDTAKSSTKGLSVIENSCQGETDLEDISNDDGDYEDQRIVIEASNVDIFHEFCGGTTTTKEGDGPFSTEVRQQMSFDEGDETTREPFTNNIIFPATLPTDSEDYEVSDEDDDIDEACGQPNTLHNFDFLANSQIENTCKMTTSLTVPDLTEDGMSDGHTDVEDFE